MSLISKKDVAVGSGVFAATAGVGGVTLGDVVAYDVSVTGDARYYTVAKADTNSSPAQLAIAGVALATASAGDEVRVQFWGFCPVVNVATGVAAGDSLCLGTTGGRGDKFVVALTGNAQTLQAPNTIFGLAAGAESSNLAAAFISVPRHQ